MRSHQNKKIPISAIICSLLVIPHLVSAAVVINEILFNPLDTDTGGEAIELYNAGSLTTDMGSWELYPDGIGYFVFPPDFALAPGAFVLIHLRASGVNTPEHLFHSRATANMGNSSGSVALFRSNVHTSASLEDFMRYHKAGAAPRDTWESTAVAAGLWTEGEAVDIGVMPEGASIGLATDGVRGGDAA